jgi:Glycosyltransferase family 25 (LPS biosynthesis protein)
MGKRVLETPSPWDWSWTDAVYCINLRERSDRRREAEAEFRRVGLLPRVTFFLAERPTRQEWDAFCAAGRGPSDGRVALTAGSLGCWRSHRAVLEHARRLGHQRVLVFEDDVRFLPTLTPDVVGRGIPAMLAALPASADFFLLGYFPYGRCAPCPIPSGAPPGLSKGAGETGEEVGTPWKIAALSTVAYVATAKGMALALDAQVKEPFDLWMWRRSEQYGLYPKVAWQRSSPSDVDERWLGLDMTGVKERANRFYSAHTLLFDELLVRALPLVLRCLAAVLAALIALYLFWAVTRGLRAAAAPRDPAGDASAGAGMVGAAAPALPNGVGRGGIGVVPKKQPALPASLVPKKQAALAVSRGPGATGPPGAPATAGRVWGAGRGPRDSPSRGAPPDESAAGSWPMPAAARPARYPRGPLSASR